MVRRSLVVITVVLLACSACGRSRQDSGSAPPDTVATTSESSLGSRVSVATDPYLRVMAPKLRDWAERWRGVMPGFTLDSLYREAGAYPVGYRRATTSADLERARVFGQLSPDSKRIVEPDMYRQKSDGEWELRPEPDAAPAIIDLRDDSLTVVTVTGTSGGFEDAFWIDRDHIVLVGYGEREYEPWRGGGDLWVLDLQNKRLTYYHTPDVAKDLFDRYVRGSEAAQRDRVRRAAPL